MRVDGSGAFTAAVGLPSSPGAAAEVRVIVFADVDGDGDADVFLGYKTHANELWINTITNGNAVFTKSTSVPTTSDVRTTTTAAFGDADGDGASRPPESSPCGASPLPSLVLASSCAVCHVAMVDAPGDIDLFVGNDNTANEIWVSALGVRRSYPWPIPLLFFLFHALHLAHPFPGKRRHWHLLRGGRPVSARRCFSSCGTHRLCSLGGCNRTEPQTRASPTCSH